MTTPTVALPHTENWYCCGPTVYDHAHIGHARTYVAVDMLRRLTEKYRAPCRYIMNITDVDDKIIARGVNPQHFEEEFWRDMDALGVKRPDSIMRVSENIPQIITFIERIIANGFAYVSDGNVWFDVDAYRAAGFTYDIREGEHDTVLNKKASYDFALWKNIPGSIAWDSPWGRGRPGWHIECSVMASHAFEFAPMHVHAGGIDLAFPHHHNEVAQVNAYHNRDVNWVGRFLHTGHVHIDGAKMSKSLKNFITIRDMLGSITGRQARILFAQRYYSDAMTFTPDLYEGARKLDRRIAEWLHTPSIDTEEGEVPPLITADIYDIPAALDRISALLAIRPTSATQRCVREYLTCIGLDYTLEVNPMADDLVRQRQILRTIAKETRNKELFKVCDDLRILLYKHWGVDIIDTADNTIRIA